MKAKIDMQPSFSPNITQAVPFFMVKDKKIYN